jgi:hypothetical protein
MDPDRAKMEIGRRMLIAGPRVAEQVDAFHKWVPEASAAVQGAQFTPVMENGRLIAVECSLGRFEVAQELSRVGEQLFARIVFYQPPTPLRKEPREACCLRFFEDSAHFGPGPDADHFDWDHDRDRWSPRNWLRLGYELALAATQPLG